MNSSKPIWTKKPKEVTDDEYNEFYKAMAKVSIKINMEINILGEGVKPK